MQRTYICDSCLIWMEHEHKNIHEKLLKKCPKCKKSKDFYQDLSGIYTYNSCRTVGALAEKNSDKETSYELQDRKRQDKYDRGMMKFEPHIQKGFIEREQATELVEKHMDVDSAAMNPGKQQELFSGTQQEQAAKITRYIEKGE